MGLDRLVNRMVPICSTGPTADKSHDTLDEQNTAYSVDDIINNFEERLVGSAI